MKHLQKYLFISLIILSIIIGATLFAQSLSQNPDLQELIYQFGYFGVILTAVVAGLNTFVPLPAATFSPIFIEAGLSIPFIIIALTIGTLIADLIGYIFGHVSREIIKNKYPKSFLFVNNIEKNHHSLITPLVILYAAFIPFPNEVILIPLALAGVHFGRLLVPLLIGNVIHQSLFVYGVTSVFEFFF